MLFDCGGIVGHGDEELLGLFDPRCTEQRIKEEEKRAKEKQNSKLFCKSPLLSLGFSSLFGHCLLSSEKRKVLTSPFPLPPATGIPHPKQAFNM